MIILQYLFILFEQVVFSCSIRMHPNRLHVMFAEEIWSILEILDRFICVIS